MPGSLEKYSLLQSKYNSLIGFTLHTHYERNVLTKTKRGKTSRFFLRAASAEFQTSR
jgi:hypothetical protein